ncbi:MAG: hypothetical protein IIC50_17655 [Planctomycetes bacterium]|nr:hypothetical protein [Planctomycetota bacterium]
MAIEDLERLENIADYRQTGLILAEAMVNTSQVSGLDSWSKGTWFLLALTSKMAGDMNFCTGRGLVDRARAANQESVCQFLAHIRHAPQNCVTQKKEGRPQVATPKQLND